jgi:hypothetical protein
MAVINVESSVPNVTTASLARKVLDGAPRMAQALADSGLRAKGDFRQNGQNSAPPPFLGVNPFASMCLYISTWIFFPLTDPLSIYISSLFIFETGFEKQLTSPIQ